MHTLGLLPNEDYRILHDGYIFLRTIEHYLQLLQYQQTHTLPSQPKAFAYLARRLGYSGEQASATFLARYEQNAQAIRTVYLRYVGEPEDQNDLPTEPLQTGQMSCCPNTWHAWRPTEPFYPQKCAAMH
jgi:glutamate-ammonia-ligase adenylyltransferase